MAGENPSTLPEGLNDLASKSLDGVTSLFPQLKEGNLDIQNKIAFISSLEASLSPEDMTLLIDILNYINTNELKKGSYEDVRDKINTIRQKITDISSRLKTKVFQDVQNINTESLQNTPIEQPGTTIPLPEPTPNKTIVEPKGESRSNYGPTGETVKTNVPVQDSSSTIPLATPILSTATVKQENNPISSKIVETYKESLKGLQSYLEAIPVNGSTDIKEFIGTTISMLSHGDIVQLLNTTDSSGKFRFQNIIKERLDVIKAIIPKIMNNEPINELFTGNDAEHLKIQKDTESSLAEFRASLAPALGVKPEDVEVELSSLTPYERIILLSTGLLPKDLVNVENYDIGEIMNGNSKGLPDSEIFGDIIYSNFYGSTADKMKKLHGLSNINSIIQAGESTFYTWIEKQVGTEFIPFYLPKDISTDDLERYLDEVDKGNITPEIKRNALKILENFSKEVGTQVAEYKKQLQDIKSGVDSSTLFMGEEMGSMVEKARAISTFLILLEGVHNDLESKFAVGFSYIVKALLLGYTVSELFNLDGLIGLFVSVGMFSPPGWMILVNILSSKKDKKLKERWNSFKKSGQDDIKVWAQGQTGIAESDIKDLERFRKHDTIVQTLINHLKSANTPEAEAQIKKLGEFRDSHRMFMNDSTWKMFLEGKLSQFDNKLVKFFQIIWKTQITGGFNALVRRGMDGAWDSNTFEKSILKHLGLKHKDFKELLDDDSLKSLTIEEIRAIHGNVQKIIDALAISEADKDIKRRLLKDYTAPILGENKPIAERPFLYTIDYIIDTGNSRTDLEKISKNTNSGFNLNTARSKFKNPDLGEIELKQAKDKLLKGINEIIGADSIRDILKGKAEKLTDKGKLESFKSDFFEPIINLLNSTRGSDIEDITKSEIEKAFTYEGDKGKIRIKELDEEIKIERTMRARISGLEADFKSAFADGIRNSIISDTDQGEGIKSLQEMLKNVGVLRQNINGLGIDGISKNKILDELRTSISGPDKALYDSINSGIGNISEIKTKISADGDGIIPQGIKDDFDTSLNDPINWGQLLNIRNNIDSILGRAEKIAIAEAGRAIMPGAPINPAPIGAATPVTEILETPTVPEVSKPTSPEKAQGELVTASGELRAEHRNLFNILELELRLNPFGTDIEKKLKDLDNLKNSRDIQTMSRADFEARIKTITGKSELPVTKGQQGKDILINLQEEEIRVKAQDYLQRVELEAHLKGISFDSSKFPTKGIKDLGTFTIMINAQLPSGITNVRSLEELFKEIEGDASVDMEKLSPEMKAQLAIYKSIIGRTDTSIKFSETIRFGEFLIKAIKTGKGF